MPTTPDFYWHTLPKPKHDLRRRLKGFSAAGSSPHKVRLQRNAHIDKRVPGGSLWFSRPAARTNRRSLGLCPLTGFSESSPPVAVSAATGDEVAISPARAAVAIHTRIASLVPIARSLRGVTGRSQAAFQRTPGGAGSKVPADAGTAGVCRFWRARARMAQKSA